MDALQVHFPEGWKKEHSGPLYRILYKRLKECIIQNVLKPSQRLPPSRNLSYDLKVSRNTVNRAYELLIDDGYVINKPGAGFYVQTDLIFEQFQKEDKKEKANRSIRACSQLAQELIKRQNPNKNVHKSMVFGFSKPPLEEFPKDVWSRMLSRRWRLSAHQLSLEKDPMGYEPLRLAIHEHLAITRGIQCRADQIMITSGSQQGIDLCARVLFDLGSEIALSDPCYDGIYDLFKSLGHKLILCPHDKEGTSLEPLLQNPNNVQAILSTPSRLFPLGVVMSLKRRMALLDLAKKKNAWIIEDDYDSELRFEGAPVPALQGLDPDGRVIYMGTFSRTMFPALRVGFLVLPDELISYFKAVRIIMDGHTSILPQAAMADFISEGYYQRHVRKLIKLLKPRRDFLRNFLSEIEQELLSLPPHDGGLHLCAFLSKKIPDFEFVKVCHANNIGVKALSPYYKQQDGQNGLVFYFASYCESEMEKALKKLNHLLHQ